MDLKCKMILEEYRAQRPAFLELGDTVQRILSDLVERIPGMVALAIEHRVKEESSLAGKLELKGEKYASLSDVTDILGARIVCFFADDVDRIAKAIEKTFVIDWENSVDKRAVIHVDTFGYLSLHYICSLATGGEYPDAICGKKFEIQIRTALQHAWAVIYHDFGYKSEFGIPRAIQRGFSQTAGLLEVADEKFAELRRNIYAYTDEVRERIANDEADELGIDGVSLNEYMKHNKVMRAFLDRLASLCVSCEIREISADIYIEQLRFLGIRTLGQLHQMLLDNADYAALLAKSTLQATDLDILSSNAALRFLCRAELLKRHYPKEKIAEFMRISFEDEVRAERQAKRLMSLVEKVKAGDDA